MENNKLIKKENGIINRIVGFFRGLFLKNNSKKIEIVNFQEEIEKKENFDDVQATTYGNIVDSREEMANKLRNGEIDSYDLSDDEAEEMIEYFTKDTERKKNELEMIRKRILSMRAQSQSF